MPRSYTGPNPWALIAICERSQGMCEYPGCRALGTQTHHRRPRRSGGTRDPRASQPSNLLRLCTDHHMWVESFRRDALDMGLLLHAGDDPAAVPVLTRHDPLPVFLADDGSWSPMERAA